MSQTLREKCGTRVIGERLARADAQLQVESRQATLITEAMDEQDLAKASAIIDKLRGMQNKGSTVLDDAIEKAVTDLNKYTGGGPLTKAWSKLKGKLGIDNPLVKIMTFANALETGFRQMPTIVKNAIGNVGPNNADKSMLELLADDEEKRKAAVNNVMKALSPKGIFGVFKKVPYADSEMLSQDLMAMPIKSLNTIVKQATSGPQSDQIATDMKDTVKGAGKAETKGTQPTSTTTSSEPSKGTAPTKGATGPTETTPTGETPQRPDGDMKAKLIKKIGPAVQDLGVKNVEKLVDVLDDLGVIKQPS